MTTLRDRLTHLVRTWRGTALDFRQCAGHVKKDYKKQAADLEMKADVYDRCAEMLEKELKK